MIKCVQCSKPIKTGEDNFVTFHVVEPGIFTNSCVEHNVHMESCAQEWLAENTIGGILE